MACGHAQIFRQIPMWLRRRGIPRHATMGICLPCYFSGGGPGVRASPQSVFANHAFWGKVISNTAPRHNGYLPTMPFGGRSCRQRVGDETGTVSKYPSCRSPRSGRRRHMGICLILRMAKAICVQKNEPPHLPNFAYGQGHLRSNVWPQAICVPNQATPSRASAPLSITRETPRLPSR